MFIDMLDPVADGGWVRGTVPSIDQLEAWMLDADGVEAPDGCEVEPDGSCPHGQPSWLRLLGLV